MTFFRLVRIFIRDAYPFFAGPDGKAPHRLRVALRLTALPVALAVGFFLFQFLLELYQNVLVAGFFIGFPQTVFFLASFLSWVLLFFLLLPAALALFIRPRANPWLCPLPLSGTAVAAARISALYLIGLPVHLFLFSPALIVAIRWAGPLEARQLPALALAAFVLPLVPAALAVLFALLLRLAPRMSRLGSFTVIPVFVLMLLALAVVEILLQESLFAAGRDRSNIFLVEFSRIFLSWMEALPPLYVAARAFRTGEEAVSVLLGLILPLSAAAAALALSARGFAREAGLSGIRAPQRHPAPGFRYGFSGALPALLFREMKLVFRHPAAALAFAARICILPAFLLFYLLAGPPGFRDAIQAFAFSSPAAAVATAACLLLLVDLTTSGAACVGGEGETLDLSLSLPLSGSFQIKSKLIFLFIASLPGFAFLVGTAHLLFGLSAEDLLHTLPALAAYLALSSAGGLYLGLRLPRRHPATFPAFLLHGSGIALFALAALLFTALGMTPRAVLLLETELGIVGAVLLCTALLRYADRRYDEGLDTA